MNAPVLFNPFVPSYKKNPYLQLNRLRAGDPVHRSDALQAWILTRYADVLRVLRDPETFSSDALKAGGPLADAIEQHYWPRFAGDALPRGPVATALLQELVAKERRYLAD